MTETSTISTNAASAAQAAATWGMWTLAQWQQALDADGPVGAAAQAPGDFAVGLRRSDGSVFLAVDRFATQPLCYRLDGGTLRFAARADELADGRADLDPQALFDYLYFHMIPAPRTVYRGVQRLPPGHCAVFENGRLTVAPYWTPKFADGRAQLSFAALRDEFRTLLRDAVAARLDGGKPACFLSGGTDSSTIAGLIGEAAGRPAATYSIGFEAEGYDEMAYARIAARRFGTEHHEYYVSPADLASGMADVAASFDQPFGNSSALPAYYCARMARHDGVQRLLAGDGGDELFGGNSRYAKQRVFGWYSHLPAALRRGVVEPLLALPGVARAPLVRKAASYVEQARVPMPDRLQMYNLLQRLGYEEVLTPAFVALVDTASPLHQQRAVWSLPEQADEVDRTLAFDWRYTLADNDLPKVRGATQLAGISAAYPFLDRAVLDFSLRLPSNFKLKGLRLRWFFKQALRGFLPDEIITKKKHGFGLPFGVWLARSDRLKAMAADAFGSLGTRGIVRERFVRGLLEHRLAQHAGYYGEMVWILMTLEYWLQRHAPDYRLQA